jgi:hypothetical protein
MNENNRGNAPEKKFLAGSVSAAVWVNETSANGSPRQFRTVSLQRSYKDKDGSWKTSHSLNIDDVPKAQVVLQKAFEYVVLREGVLPNGAVPVEQV